MNEDLHNYAMLATSGDDRRSWSELKLVLDPDGPGPVRAFDPGLWHDPQGLLWLFWGQKDSTSMHNFAIMAEAPSVEASTWSKPAPLQVSGRLSVPGPLHKSAPPFFKGIQKVLLRLVQ